MPDELLRFLSKTEGVILVELYTHLDRPSQFPPSDVIREALQSRLGRPSSIEDRSSPTMSLFRVDYSDEREAESMHTKLHGTQIKHLGLGIRCDFLARYAVSRHAYRGGGTLID